MVLQRIKPRMGEIEVVSEGNAGEEEKYVEEIQREC